MLGEELTGTKEEPGVRWAGGAESESVRERGAHGRTFRGAPQVRSRPGFHVCGCQGAADDGNQEGSSTGDGAGDEGGEEEHGDDGRCRLGRYRTPRAALEVCARRRTGEGPRTGHLREARQKIWKRRPGEIRNRRGAGQWRGADTMRGERRQWGCFMREVFSPHKIIA
jgi:hypothetical protein